MIGQTIGEAIAGGIAYGRDAAFVRDLPAFADASPEEIRGGVNALRRLDFDGHARQRVADSGENGKLLRQIVGIGAEQSYYAAAASASKEEEITVWGSRLDRWLDTTESAFVNIGGLDTGVAADAVGLVRSRVSDAYGAMRGLPDAAQPAYGSWAVDGILMAAGNTAQYVSQEIGKHPWLQFSLEAISFVMSPAQFALGMATERLTGPLIERVSNLAAQQFTNAGYGREQAMAGAIGALAIGSLAVGAIAGGFRRAIGLVRNGIQRLRLMRFGEAARYERHWDNLASAPGTLSSRSARAWYLSQEERIPNLIDRTQPLDMQARQAFEMRNDIRTQARDLMADRDRADFLGRTEPNMTWNQIVERYTSQGYTGDALWNRILGSSQRSRQSVNRSLGVE